MRNWRAYVALTVVFCLYQLSLVQSLSAASLDTSSIQRQVSDFGVGANLNLKLAGGKKLRGAVEAIDDAGFLVSERDKPGVRLRYSDVAQVKLANRAYRANGQPDPLGARRVVLNLGVGRHAVVKFAGQELHGHIQSIGADAFTLLPDRETSPVQIAYSDVTYVEKNLSLGGTIVLVVLIVAAVVVISAVAATR
jgi:ribosome maturation factor RimP